MRVVNRPIPVVSIALCLLAASTALGCGSSSSGSSPAANPGADGGQAITGLTASTWKWVSIPGTSCRDGTETGIGVNLGTKTDHLMIYLEGGGACFNDTTCSYMNPSHFDSSNFATQIGAEGELGIFNRADSKNPVADWSFVYVPYCTGDIHAGNNPAGNVPGLGVQKFVGYANVGLDLQRVVPTFPGLKQVLLTGISAGGFGAAANYVQVAKAFSPVPVSLLDDSGPAMENPYNATCLQMLCDSLWGLDKGSLQDCDGECTNPASYQLDFIKHVAKTYPNVPLGLIESTQDAVITLFYGFGTDDGKNDCNGSLTTPEDPNLFTQGLQDLAAQTKAFPNVGAFIFASTQHTSLLTSLDTETTPASGVAGSTPVVALSDWITTLVNQGTITTVGLPPAASDGGVADDGGDAGM